ncbi:Uncharacterised protein [Mycobacteroides abscessus subsp. massiliense]|nr:Uncharacterised protein [Mycobacteroides abscessus subsp. massiliense]
MVIGKENKAFGVDFFQQYHAAVGPAVFAHGGNVDRGRFVDFGVNRFVQPLLELDNRVGVAFGFRQLAFAVIFADIVQIHDFPP